MNIKMNVLLLPGKLNSKELTQVRIGRDVCLLSALLQTERWVFYLDPEKLELSDEEMYSVLHDADPALCRSLDRNDFVEEIIPYRPENLTGEEDKKDLYVVWQNDPEDELVYVPYSCTNWKTAFSRHAGGLVKDMYAEEEKSYTVLSTGEKGVLLVEEGSLPDALRSEVKDFTFSPPLRFLSWEHAFAHLSYKGPGGETNPFGIPPHVVFKRRW